MIAADISACNCSAITYSFNLISTPLPLYLDGLKFCECSEFFKECEDRDQAITPYHQLVYDKFCSPSKFDQICDDAESDLSHFDDVARMCGQVLQYNRDVEYDDWLIGWSPFCPTYAFGASKSYYDVDPAMTSPYNNMPSVCRSLTLFAISLFYFLCIAIVFANVTVLMVVRRDKYFHSPYGYFKASIAVADLLVGLLVVPSLIYHLHWITFAPRPFRSPGTISRSVYESREPFYVTIGFFTILTLSNSVYCLVASSLDRYFSITRPFSYEAKKLLTKKRALCVIMVIWLLSSGLAIFPIASSSTTYGVVSASFVLATEKVEISLTSVPTFSWKGFFNVTSSASDVDGNETMKKNYTQLYNLTSEEMASINLRHFRASLSSRGMYLILSMYFLCLIVPLIFVLIVNCCLVRSFKRQKKKNNFSAYKRHSVDPRNRGQSLSGATISSSQCVTSSSSITSLKSALADDERKAGIQKLEDHVITKLSSGNFLTIPHPVHHGRRAMSVAIPTCPIRNENSPRPSIMVPVDGASRNKNLAMEEDVTKRMSRIIRRMVIAFTIGVLPAILSLVTHIIFANQTDVYSAERYSTPLKLFQNSFAFIASVFLYGNSFVNCVIYTLLGSRFRKTAKRVYSIKVSTKVNSIRDALQRISFTFERKSSEESNSSSIPRIVEGQV
ncbi:unnamed protein product [Clavelina lepadiformis]|uniref:G-protein coupled receptors family 1 profile domain-containing protein n=1 Tax=Clavelina lepadiformis TaxID=159417 RepID=A0ABP0GSV8_CLALP